MIIHSTIFYTWRHPLGSFVGNTIWHTLSGFGRESPVGHPRKAVFSHPGFLRVVFPQSWILITWQAALPCAKLTAKRPCQKEPSKKDFTLSSGVKHLCIMKVQLYSTQLSAGSPSFAPLPGHACVMTDLDFDLLQIDPVWRWYLFVQGNVEPSNIFWEYCARSCQSATHQDVKRFWPKRQAIHAQSAICKKILQNFCFFLTKKKDGNLVQKSWEVCELLTYIKMNGTNGNHLFAVLPRRLPSEMFHRCYTFLWWGPKGSEDARWGVLFYFGCRRDELSWVSEESGCEMMWLVEQTGLQQITVQQSEKVVTNAWKISVVRLWMLVAHKPCFPSWCRWSVLLKTLQHLPAPWNTRQDRASKAPGVFWAHERAKTPVKSSAKGSFESLDGYTVGLRRNFC